MHVLNIWKGSCFTTFQMQRDLMWKEHAFIPPKLPLLWVIFILWTLSIGITYSNCLITTSQRPQAREPSSRITSSQYLVDACRI